jgi:hypothetical protein
MFVLVAVSIAAGIAARDGFPSNADDIFLTDGASPAVIQNFLLIFISISISCLTYTQLPPSNYFSYRCI